MVKQFRRALGAAIDSTCVKFRKGDKCGLTTNISTKYFLLPLRPEYSTIYDVLLRDIPRGFCVT